MKTISIIIVSTLIAFTISKGLLANQAGIYFLNKQKEMSLESPSISMEKVREVLLHMAWLILEGFLLRTTISLEAISSLN